MAAKVLLVEDDNNLREIYEARLLAEGYTIVTAKDGEEALVVAKNELPDLIISDVMMPRVSGFEMLDILRNTDTLKGTKVIMLTALGQADDKTRGSSLGADRYLVKSQVTLEDIVKAAHELLQDTATPGTPNPAQPSATAGTNPGTSALPQAPVPPLSVQPQPVAATDDDTARGATAPAMPPAPVAMPKPPSATSAPAAPPAVAPSPLDASAVPARPQTFGAPTPDQDTAAAAASTSTPTTDAAADATMPTNSSALQDDAVLAGAVEDLTQSTGGQTAEPAGPAPMPAMPPYQVSPQGMPPLAPQPEPAAPPAPGNMLNAASRRVIQPLSPATPQRSIHDLLAEEDARNIVAGGPASMQPVAIQPSSPVAPAAPPADTSAAVPPSAPMPAAPAVPDPASAPPAPLHQPGTTFTPTDFDPNNIAL